MNKIKIVVVSHKPYPMPKDPIYVPVEVGAGLREEHFFDHRDDQGEDNISKKNPYYCELTALYWAYKNLDDYDVLGLVHYRRYFMKNSFCFRKNLDNIISQKEIDSLLSKYDIILPKKRHYFIETNYSHYIHMHPKEPLDIAREVIKQDYPEYLSYYDDYMKETTGHYFNMFITRKEIALPFLEWLFDILSKVEAQIDISKYSEYDKRVYGFVSERLFDVYCRKHHLKIKNQKYLFFENQNWPRKIFEFIKRKLCYNKKDK